MTGPARRPRPEIGVDLPRDARRRSPDPERPPSVKKGFDFVIDDKTRKVIKYLQECEPKEGYYLAFSGGKDSCVCKALLDMAQVKYEAVYRVTSVDPPELVRFIRDRYPDVKREVPRDK